MNEIFGDSTKPETDLFKSFMDHLRGLVNEPPYKIFIFISPILLVITLIWQKYFVLFFIFFLYSVFGLVWRHAVKDFRGRIEKVYENKEFNKINLLLTGIYQLVNIALVIVLVIIMIFFVKGNL